MLLTELARRIGAELRGAGAALEIQDICALADGHPSAVTYVSAQKYRSALRATHAGAVILTPALAGDAPCPCLLVDNPVLAFARAAELLHPRRRAPAGCHPSAVIAMSAEVHPTASIGALCVIEEGVRIAAGVEIGPQCVIQRDSLIGAETRLVAAVTVCERTIIGKRVLLHPGAVIGREGFGFARDGERWIRIPQIGRVRLGDDVEVGANSAVDRGAIGETVIGNGVKIDNLIQIGHNVEVGEHTAMAACSGISGSTRIGKGCTIAGAVGMAGHLEIGDDVHFTGMAMVTRSFAEPGTYSSGIPAMSSADWRRNVARFRHLDAMAKRLRRLEERVAELQEAQREQAD
ncbi:MAG: UDP-3-O-(3-hydroxymyristoyl)glucosamine N-acyltransferase [Lamprobacter sp.]|uniref:UDP-3-O-(3-hydroxymyristoyl)glucosamine N-acyltransferase n=1 Tax=Lamprobacter sp. TaxID=3100796 RepID=UPI002B263B6B|nr:UDP-3-O-(3-hydroxymyristoyl)glucosamine N-acyltransferase [Lamprobacter sp.]MEA3639411.1 UDP-3-O-(3-hydroxymyristoyl)glucosamine N-acyltransferase [Lamprobacter sp.]